MINVAHYEYYATLERMMEMKYFILTVVSLVLAYLSWVLYNSVDSWKFVIAFMGGGIDACLLTFMLMKK